MTDVSINVSNFDMFLRCVDAVDMFGGSDDPASPAAGQGDAPGADAGQSLTALLVVLTAPRCRGCVVGLFVLEAPSSPPAKRGQM